MTRLATRADRACERRRWRISAGLGLMASACDAAPLIDPALEGDWSVAVWREQMLPYQSINYEFSAEQRSEHVIDGSLQVRDRQLQLVMTDRITWTGTGGTDVIGGEVEWLGEVERLEDGGFELSLVEAGAYEPARLACDLRFAQMLVCHETLAGEIMIPSVFEKIVSP